MLAGAAGRPQSARHTMGGLFGGGGAPDLSGRQSRKSCTRTLPLQPPPDVLQLRVSMRSRRRLQCLRSARVTQPCPLCETAYFPEPGPLPHHRPAHTPPPTRRPRLPLRGPGPAHSGFVDRRDKGMLGMSCKEPRTPTSAVPEDGATHRKGVNSYPRSPGAYQSQRNWTGWKRNRRCGTGAQTVEEAVFSVERKMSIIR